MILRPRMDQWGVCSDLTQPKIMELQTRWNSATLSRSAGRFEGPKNVSRRKKAAREQSRGEGKPAAEKPGGRRGGQQKNVFRNFVPFPNPRPTRLAPAPVGLRYLAAARKTGGKRGPLRRPQKAKSEASPSRRGKLFRGGSVLATPAEIAAPDRSQPKTHPSAAISPKSAGKHKQYLYLPG
jgi:hypothetical protein